MVKFKFDAIGTSWEIDTPKPLAGSSGTARGFSDAIRKIRRQAAS